MDIALTMCVNETPTVIAALRAPPGVTNKAQVFSAILAELPRVIAMPVDEDGQQAIDPPDYWTNFAPYFFANFTDACLEGIADRLCRRHAYVRLRDDETATPLSSLEIYDRIQARGRH